MHTQGVCHDRYENRPHNDRCILRRTCCRGNHGISGETDCRSIVLQLVAALFPAGGKSLRAVQLMLALLAGGTETAEQARAFPGGNGDGVLAAGAAGDGVLSAGACSAGAGGRGGICWIRERCGPICSDWPQCGQTQQTALHRSQIQQAHHMLSKSSFPSSKR